MRCIVCEKEIKKEEAIDRYDVSFCSEACITDYEKRLKDLEGIINWDKCC